MRGRDFLSYGSILAGTGRNVLQPLTARERYTGDETGHSGTVTTPDTAVRRQETAVWSSNVALTVCILFAPLSPRV